jgi:transcriptional regulator with XRE-family HTH domain
MSSMAVHNNVNPSTHFGRQVKKERLAHGWSLRELSARSGIDFSHLSRIEAGKRAPTEAVADALDTAFPDRRGWFREFYEDSKSAIPPGLRSWTEHEDRAARLSLWCPGTVHGLLQTESYARVYLSTLPGVPGEVIDARLASRMERQQRVLHREDPPVVACVIDHAALYRMVGSPDVMAEQCAHLLEVASMPNVTMQVLPAVAHPASASELIIADNSAAYCEHLAAGGVYTEPVTVARLELVFTTIRSECYRASDSAAIIRKAEQTWTGESRHSAARTGLASR